MSQRASIQHYTIQQQTNPQQNTSAHKNKIIKKILKKGIYYPLLCQNTVILHSKPYFSTHRYEQLPSLLREASLQQIESIVDTTAGHNTEMKSSWEPSPNRTTSTPQILHLWIRKHCERGIGKILRVRTLGSLWKSIVKHLSQKWLQNQARINGHVNVGGGSFLRNFSPRQRTTNN